MYKVKTLVKLGITSFSRPHPQPNNFHTSPQLKKKVGDENESKAAAALCSYRL